MVTEEPVSLAPRRKWFAITIATVATLISYSFILFAFVAGSTEDGGNPGPALALGLALVPFVFLLAAFMTRNRAAAGSVLKAMGLFLLVGISVGALDIVSGLVAGFGAGAVVTVRSDEPHTRLSRSVAVLLAVVYTFVLVRFVQEAALIAAAILPFLAVGMADSFTEWRAARAARD